MKKVFIIFLISISLSLHSEPFTLIFEKELNPNGANIICMPCIINESEIGMIIRNSNLKVINQINNLVQKEIPEPEYTIEYNYIFEIFNIANNTFTQYDLPFLTGSIVIQEINYSQLKKELYIELSGYRNAKKLRYLLDSKELTTFENFNSANLSFESFRPLKISENQMLAILIDEECENYAYDNYYEEYIGKVILYNSNEIQKAKKGNFDKEKIIQVFNDSKGNNILASDVYNPIYNPEFNVLLVRSEHFLNENKSTTLYLFKKGNY